MPRKAVKVKRKGKAESETPESADPPEKELPLPSKEPTTAARILDAFLKKNKERKEKEEERKRVRAEDNYKPWMHPYLVKFLCVEDRWKSDYLASPGKSHKYMAEDFQVILKEYARGASLEQLEVYGHMYTVSPDREKGTSVIPLLDKIGLPQRKHGKVDIDISIDSEALVELLRHSSYSHSSFSLLSALCSLLLLAQASCTGNAAALPPLLASRYFPNILAVLGTNDSLTPVPSALHLMSSERTCPASALPSSTPHWSNELIPHTNPLTAILCS